MARISRKYAASTITVTVLLHVSQRSYTFFWDSNNNARQLQFMLLIIPIFSTIQSSMASSNNEHSVVPSLPSPYRPPQQDITIYKCDESDFPSNIESFLDKLQVEASSASTPSSSELPKSDFALSSHATVEETMEFYKKKYERESRRKFFENNNDNINIDSNDRDRDAIDLAREKRSVNEIQSGEWWEPNELLLGTKKKCPSINYRLIRAETRFLNCQTRSEFHWHPLYNQLPNMSNNGEPKISLTNLSLIEDGDLVWNKEESENHVFKRDDYCLWKQGKEGWISFKVCNTTSSEINRVRKCCPPHYIIDEMSRKCIPASPKWRPIFYRSESGDQEQSKEGTGQKYFIIYGYPNCPKKYRINGTPVNHFKLLLNGSLVLIDGPKKTMISEGEFCIDGIKYANNKDEFLYSGSEWDQVVIACKPPQQWDIWRIPLYAALNFLSALFLLLTVCVYLILWRQQNIHGWLQFSYVTSLLGTFSSFTVVQVWSDELMAISPSLCKIMGWITHLTYLSAFFWLTSMNFDLWWRFSRPLKSIQLRPQEQKLKRFLRFAVFSVCIPLLISCIGIGLDYLYGWMLLEPPFTIPGFGKEKCYFESRMSQLPYIYGPAGILLLIDLTFFASTVLHLRKMHLHTEIARTQSTAAMEDRKGLRIIAKLFFVMGVLWMFELASWIAHYILPDNKIVICVFLPADILNSLQGVAIFFIFVWKPNVGNQLLAIFKKHKAAKAWNRQTQLPSVITTFQQPLSIKPHDFIAGVKCSPSPTPTFT